MLRPVYIYIVLFSAWLDMAGLQRFTAVHPRSTTLNSKATTYQAYRPNEIGRHKSFRMSADRTRHSVLTR